MSLRPVNRLLLLALGWVGNLGSTAPYEGHPTAQIVGQRSGFTGAYPSAVVPDARGRLWVATDLGGLFVGDGHRFLKVDLPEALQGKGIGDMAADVQGRLWILSTGGLGTLDHGAWRVDGGIRDRAVPSRRRTAGLFAREDGALVMLASGKAYRLTGGSPPTPFTLPGAEADGEVSLAWQLDRLIVNRGGRFWREEDEGWATLPTLPLQPSELPQGPIQCDAQGHLYLLTDRRLGHLPPGGLAWRTLPYGPMGDGVRSTGDGVRMTRLQDGQIWILNNQGAQRILGGVPTRVPMPPDLSLYGAEARCLDPEGNLWITRQDLVRLPVPGLVSAHTGPGYPPAKEIWNLLKDPSGALWVASEAGLSRRNEGGWLTVNGIPAARGLDLGPDGWLYLRSGHSLMRVEPRTLKVAVTPIPLGPGGLEVRRGPVVRGDHMWVVDVTGRVAVGTWQQGSWSWAWEAVPPSPGWSPRLYRDREGGVWLAHEHRFFCNRKDRWEEIPLPAGRRIVDLTFPKPDQALAVQFNPPTVFTVSRSGSEWVTHTLIDPKDLSGITTLYAVRQAPGGIIWLNTDQGVLRVDPNHLADIQRFGTALGLPAEDTDQESLLVESDDHVWVGSAQGLAEIRMGKNPALPPLVAPSLLEARCGAWVRPGPDPDLTIRHGQGSVIWELGFPGPMRGDGAHFEFREVGGTWATLAGTALQFPEISPGRHAYEVRVVPFIGPPGPALRLNLQVLPPWYRHPAAYVLWLALLIGAVVNLYRWRVRQLRQRNRELSLAVAEATQGLRDRERDLEKVNRRLYELNDAKNRIIGMAAHDLRNPLSGILLNCELLEEDLQVPAAAKSLGAIRSLGSTMKDLIQRLLDVHAIEAGHAEAPQMIAQDLEAAVVHALERAQNASARKGITLAFAFPGPALALGDPTQVGQILDNLLSNAIKFSPSGTTITLGLDADDAHWRVSVKDQGPGLTAADLELVFGEYARLSAQPTAGESSVGLGLSLVKRLAEAMGGRVGVASVQGQGATFWLALPKA